MDFLINLNALKDLENSNIKIDAIQLQKMILLYNAIENGWTVKKRKDSYIFLSKHDGKKDVLDDDYLLKFMKNNLDINKLFK